MDANGQRFWLLRDAAAYARPPDAPLPPAARFDPARKVLRLASQGPLDLPRPTREDARAAAEGRPAARDPFGTFATVAEDGRTVIAHGVALPPLPIFEADADETVGDLVLSADGVLHLALGREDGTARLVLNDRRGRFENVELALDDFAPDRLAASGDGPVFALDRAGRRLARVAGAPLPRLARTRRAESAFRACAPNPDPPRLDLVEGIAFPEDREIVGFAALAPERLAFLLWPGAGGAAEIMLYEGGRLLPARPLRNRRQVESADGIEEIVTEDIEAPFALAPLGGTRLALLLSGWAEGRVREAVAFEVDPGITGGEPLLPLGERFSMPDWAETRPINGTSTPSHYLTDDPPRTKPLVRLSLAASARQAVVPAGTSFDSDLGLFFCDGGEVGFVWHRLYLEAALPPGTRLTVRLAAAESRDELQDAPEFPHLFGGPAPDDDTPHAAWLPQASELPFHEGLLDCPRERGRSGLFTCLIQRRAMADRALRGRYLKITLVLEGEGRASPEIAALRAWGPRFCYRDHYLPALYREAVPAKGGGKASGADFLGRYLALFESLLTPLEDRVASAFRMTAPETVPDEALDWLASWVGLAFATGLPERRRRRMLKEATRLWRWRGTLQGLERALDIVTDDMAERGDLVVVEHFRLKRTFSTILGARLAPQDDPLLPGRHLSGNSIVGRTLFLGETEQREFLALFRPDQLQDAGEREAVAAFLDTYAHRVTVLVNRAVDEATLALIRRTVAEHAPAHVEARVAAASRPLILGLTSLLAVETYLRPRPPRDGIALGTSRLGANSFLYDTPSLDPRLEGGQA